MFDTISKVRLAANGGWMGEPMTDKRFLEFEELVQKAEEEKNKAAGDSAVPTPLHQKEHGVGCILAGSLKINKVPPPPPPHPLSPTRTFFVQVTCSMLFMK